MQHCLQNSKVGKMCTKLYLYKLNPLNEIYGTHVAETALILRVKDVNNNKHIKGQTNNITRELCNNYNNEKSYA